MLFESSEPAMLPRHALHILSFTVLTLAVSAPAVRAADLPPRTSLGEIFSEPRPARVAVQHKDRYADKIAPWVNNSPWVPGYYGRSGDFYYRSYYSTPLTAIYSRFPYACKFYASC